MKRLAHFLWDFVVGDDWRIAAGVVGALMVTVAVQTWWLLPVVVAAMLTVSVVSYAARARR